jgi:hypothetical protein
MMVTVNAKPMFLSPMNRNSKQTLIIAFVKAFFKAFLKTKAGSVLLSPAALLCAVLFYSPAWGMNLDLTNTITVVTYHNIVADPGDDSYALSRSMFVAQMDYLQTHGYQPISLAQLDEYRKHPERLPAKPIMLTFYRAGAQNLPVPLSGQHCHRLD